MGLGFGILSGKGFLGGSAQFPLTALDNAIKVPFASTFTRASSQTVPDWEGIYRTVPTDIPAVPGARLVRNLQTDHSNLATWLVSGGASAVPRTLLADGVWQLDFTGQPSGGGIYRLSPGIPSGTKLCISLEMRTVSGSGDMKIETASGLASGVNKIVTVDEAWRRFSSGVGTLSSSTADGLYLRKQANTPDLILVRNIMMEDVTGQSNQAPGEFVGGYDLGPELWAASGAVISGGFVHDGVGLFTASAPTTGAVYMPTGSNFGAVGEKYLWDVEVTTTSGSINLEAGANGDSGNEVGVTTTGVYTSTIATTLSTNRPLFRGISFQGTVRIKSMRKMIDRPLSKWFDTENGNTVDGSGVVTEATGPALHPFEDHKGIRDYLTLADRADSTGYAYGDRVKVGKRWYTQTAVMPELVTNGGFDADISGWSLAAGIISWNAGRLQVQSGGAFGRANTSFPTIAGKKYRIAWTVAPDSPNNPFLHLGTVAGGVDIQNNVHTISNPFVFTATTATTWVQIGCLNATNGQYTLVDNVSVKEVPTTAASAPSFSTTLGQTVADGSVTWTDSGHYCGPFGVLLEEARTNLITYSADLSNGVWPKTGATVSSGVADDFFGSVCRITEDTTTNLHFAQSSAISFTNAVVYTQTLVVKPESATVLQMLFSSSSHGAEAYANFNLSTGQVGTKGTAATATIETLAGGYYKCTLTATATATVAISGVYVILTGNNASAVRAPSYTGTSSSLLVAYGQCEQGSFATSYIPTAGATTTRAATNLSVPNPLPANDFTVYVEMDPVVSATATSGFPGIFKVFLDANNDLYCYYNGSNVSLRKRSGGPTMYTATVSSTTLLSNKVNKVVSRLSSISGSSLFLNGVTGTANNNTLDLNSGSAPMNIGFTDSYATGKIPKVIVFRKPLSDADCLALSNGTKKWWEIR